MRQPNPVKALTKSQHAYLFGALVATGAAALAVELVGARVLSPYYGSSIYVWSAQITVTLVSLAAGYHLGGRWADRGASLTLFARLVTWAAAGVAVVPLLRAPVLAGTTDLGVQWGALASALVLFSPSLVLLGAVGPVAVKLTTEGLSGVGRGAGDVYSISTVGSVVGAVLTGFWLIPNFSVSSILFGLAIILLLLGALGSWFSRLKIPLPQLATAAACALFWPRIAAPPRGVLASRESAYGQIKIFDTGEKRYLLVNGTAQSVADTTTLESDSQYSHSIEWAALQRPRAKTALVVGIGAGLLPKALERHYGLTVDSVDIDPAIVETARTYFDFRPKGKVTVEDGRLFVEHAPKQYDLIFIDAFGTETPPYHLFTVESFKAFRRALAPDGILAVNLVSKIHGPGVVPWQSAEKTLREVFPDIRTFSASDTYADLGNVLFFCSFSPLPDAAPVAPRPAGRADIATMLLHELRPDPALGVTMTDDYAPLESLVAQTAVVWRKKLQEKAFFRSVLLY